jgi:tRNA(Arg) A34 adenosine deaminase TadA
MELRIPKLILKLPDWVENFFATLSKEFPSVQDRIKLAVTLSRLNIENKTGGPFGAAVFEQQTGRLVSVGVNQVQATNCSIAHAEILAIAFAQHLIGHYDLASKTGKSYELVTSTEPCAMCLGALSWSGIQRVICGARDEDARSIGFDEGAKPDNWISSLEARRISVVRDVYRDQAKAVLEDYRRMGGLIYNSNRQNVKD